jgi:hypothetical protein
MAEHEQDPLSSALRRLPRFDVSEPRTRALRTRAHAELRAATAARRRPLWHAAGLASELILAAGYSLYVLGKLVALLSLSPL